MKHLAVCVLLCALLFSFAAAEPFLLEEDLADVITVLYDESDPKGGKYVYSYRYPHAAAEDPDAALINTFFEYLVTDAVEFGIPMDSDDYADMGISATREITYTLTCNNDDCLSLLVSSTETAEGQSYTNWTGYSFSRSRGSPGSTLTLPQLLNILATDENDTWLQDRQTAKAEALIRELVWSMVEDNPLDIPYYDEFDEEYFNSCFFPEEDFYLDEEGDPVFYLQPGTAAPLAEGLLEYPISLDLILDEM